MEPQIGRPAQVTEDEEAYARQRAIKTGAFGLSLGTLGPGQRIGATAHARLSDWLRNHFSSERLHGVEQDYANFVSGNLTTGIFRNYNRPPAGNLLGGLDHFLERNPADPVAAVSKFGKYWDMPQDIIAASVRMAKTLKPSQFSRYLTPEREKALLEWAEGVLSP